jgi:hypothetical protein
MRTTAQLVADLEATRDATLGYYVLADRELALTYGPGKWSVRYVLHHLSDAECVLHERIRRVLSEPDQTLMVFDQDRWAAALDYERMPMELSRDVFAAARRSVIYLVRQYYESHGHLTFVHSSMGSRTLALEMEKVADHNAKHLAHIRKALALGAANS